jgi:hypothetical protein
METNFSSILCVADINITRHIDQCLTDLALPEVYIQRAKQISLEDKHGFFGLRPSTKLDESRALLYRLYVPAVYEEGIMRRIADAADLKMGGRGSILSHRVNISRGAPILFDEEKLNRLCGKTDRIPQEKHALVTCIVSRDSGESLAQAVLELGICVPIIFFGAGVGLRDRLGLLRITIPVEKEVIWFIVPRYDAELVEKTIIHRARLDVPGQGFLYKCFVHAPVVNLRIRQGKRVHAATMEQVITALDEVHGSSDWRRQGSRKSEAGEKKELSTRGLFFIGEEGEVETFRRTAMDIGARGATLYPLEMRSYNKLAQEQAMESNSRQLCDIIMTKALEGKFKEPIAQTGLFENDRSCVLKSFNVEMPSVISSARTFTG